MTGTVKKKEMKVILIVHLKAHKWKCTYRLVLPSVYHFKTLFYTTIFL